MSRVLNIVFNDFTRDSRVRKISSSLVKAGHSVTVQCLWEPGLEREFVQDGYRVRRLEIVSRKWKSILLLRPLMWLEFTWKTIIRTSSYDLVHVNDVEPLGIAIVMRILSFGRVKMIYDAHELESEKTGMGSSGKLMVKVLERMSFPFVNGFITVSRSIAEIYRKRHGVEPILLFNCPHRKEYHGKNNGLREEFNIDDSSLIFIYQGGLAPKRGLDFLLDAFENIDDKSKHLVVLGFGRLEPMVKDYASRNENIHFKPGVPMEELLAVTAGADVGFSLLSKDSLNHELALPNKFFEYISARIPVIVSPVQEMRTIVQEKNIGWVMEGNSSDAVAAAVNRVSKEEMVDKSKNLAELAEDYVWEEQEKRLMDLYARVSA